MAATRTTIRTSAHGAYLRRVRGARAAHKVIRASGRVPGEEARAAVARYRELRKQRREYEQRHGIPMPRGGHSGLMGI